MPVHSPYVAPKYSTSRRLAALRMRPLVWSGQRNKRSPGYGPAWMTQLDTQSPIQNARNETHFTTYVESNRCGGNSEHFIGFPETTEDRNHGLRWARLVVGREPSKAESNATNPFIWRKIFRWLIVAPVRFHEVDGAWAPGAFASAGSAASRIILARGAVRLWRRFKSL
jgi:hypothetical protein